MLNPIRILIIVVLFVVQNVCLAQEICDNGVDDDGDGLIDLQDVDDCNCFYEATPSLFPNPSFEDTLCCPKQYSQVNCATGWSQASAATSDYYNLCGYSLPIQVRKPYDGNGYVGYYDKSTYKEYVGVCLKDTLYAGKNYQLQFYMALGYGDSVTSIAAFGSQSCSNLPFGGSDAWFGCPTNGSGWFALDSVTVNFKNNEWRPVVLNFTPTVNITAVVLGPGCKTRNQTDYYFLDALTLFKESAFNRRPEITSSGHFCQGNITLHARYDDKPNAVQWYRNGIALLGARDTLYNMPNGETGSYVCRLLYDDSCVNSFPFIVKDSGKQVKFELDSLGLCYPNKDMERRLVVRKVTGGTKPYLYKIDANIFTSDSVFVNQTNGLHQFTVRDSNGCEATQTYNIDSFPTPEVNLGGDTFICETDTLVISPRGSGATYLWHDGSTQNMFTVTSPGMYKVTGFIGFCSVSDSIVVDYDDCKATLELFNVFTPGQDGTNDNWEILFKGYDEIEVEIFNRWGERIVQYTLPYDKSWNGKVDNIGDSCPDGTYFYSIRARESKSQKVHKYLGVITLINE